MIETLSIENVFTIILSVISFVYVWFFQKRKIGISLLGLALIILAVFFTEKSFIIPLCLIAESAFIVCERKFNKLYFNFIIWFPALFALVFHDGIVETILIFSTLVLKNISWPFYQDEKATDEITNFVQSFLVPVLIWKNVQLQEPALWSLTCLCLIPLFSLKMNTKQVLTLNVLALISMGQPFSVVGIVFGILFFSQSIWVITSIISCAFVGFLVWNQNIPIAQELKIAALIVIALSQARVFIYNLNENNEKAKTDQILVQIAFLIFMATCIFLNPSIVEKLTLGDGLYSAIALFVSTMAAYFLHKKRPEIFKPTKALFVFNPLKSKIEKVSNILIKNKNETRITTFNLGLSYLDIIDREVHIFVLLSIVTLFLMWGFW